MAGAAPDYEQLLHSIYGAVGASDLWPSAMSLLADFTGSASTCFFMWNKQQNRFSLTAPSARMNPTAIALYEDYYGHRDEAVPLLMRKAVGEPLVCQDYFTDDYVRRSEFYNEFLIPVGGVRYRVGTRLVDNKNVAALLAVNRARREGPFTATDISLIERIGRHVARAAELHLRVTSVGAQNEMFTGVLDRISEGIILVDARRKVLLMNHAAEHIIAAGDTLTIRRGQIGTTNPHDSDQLYRRIAAATSVSNDADELTGALAVGSSSSPCPLVVTVAPVTKHLAVQIGNEGAVAAILFRTPVTDGSMLACASAFGLTSAEKRLAAGLVAGMTLDEIAARNGVAKNTVRNQLRSIFSKTGTNRQAELVRLLSV
jgi:DNA-binding CsgD family transcriptional regulator/PAS domain-containing protein